MTGVDAQQGKRASIGAVYSDDADAGINRAVNPTAVDIVADQQAVSRSQARWLSSFVCLDNGVGSEVCQWALPSSRVMGSGAGVCVRAKEKDVFRAQAAASRHRLSYLRNLRVTQPEQFHAAQRQGRLPVIEHQCADVKVVMNAGGRPRTIEITD